MGRQEDKTEDPRRRLLLKALAAATFSLGISTQGWSEVFGKVPRPLPAGRSIYEVTGLLTVNSTVADQSTLIRAGDLLETGPDGHVIFVVGKDAFILREKSQLRLMGDGFVVETLRLATGALLSVFGKGQHHIQTPVATAGIRGTGVYVEASPELTYLCTCYGTTEIIVVDRPHETETVTATHHEPRYIAAHGDRRIRKAPFKSHTDFELMLIEALVDRVPPFALFDDGYGAVRRY